MIEPDMGGLDRAARAVAGAGRIVVVTGAGMSRESGIPTFRDAQEGLWARYDPAELATREGFCSDPARVWGWYGYRRRLIHRCEPHAGHRVLARLDVGATEFVVVTQNIDGLHQRAGSRRVVELHGNLERFKCFDADHPIEGDVPVPARDGPAEPPLCERCGSPIRPDVVWFGESLPPTALELAERFASSCDVMLVVGTSGLVYPATGLPHLARASGATTIEINTRPSELTPHLDIFLRGRAGHVLPLLLARLEGEGSSGESDG